MEPIIKAAQEEAEKCLKKDGINLAFGGGTIRYLAEGFLDTLITQIAHSVAEAVRKEGRERIEQAHMAGYQSCCDREEERERIEVIFKEHIPPHAMDLEDSVWLKRLLNKAFQHENLY